MPNQQNVDQLTAIKESLSKAQNVIIVDYSGLNVATQTDLRAKIKEAGGEMAVTKNTLVALALKDRLVEGLPRGLEEALRGPNATIYSFQDPVSATKAIVDFAKTNENLEIKMGLLVGQDGNPDQIMTKEQILDLAKLPGKQELLAMLVSRLNSPIVGFVNVLQGNIRGLVYALEAIRKQKDTN
jgi:large subunit ribosomal protein L10